MRSNKFNPILANIEFNVPNDVGHQGTHVETARCLELDHLSELGFHGLADRVLLLDSSGGILIFDLKNIAFEFTINVEWA